MQSCKLAQGQDMCDIAAAFLTNTIIPLQDSTRAMGTEVCKRAEQSHNCRGKRRKHMTDIALDLSQKKISMATLETSRRRRTQQS